MKKRVTGIGGVFFKCKDPKTTRDWYGKHLGLVTNEYGSLFEFRIADHPDEKGIPNGARWAQTPNTMILRRVSL